MWYFVYPDTGKVNELPFFLHSIGLHELQPPIAKPAGHEFDQFFYNSTGDGMLVIYGKKLRIPEGSGFFVPAGVPHEYYPLGNVWDIRWMVPRGDGLGSLYEKLGIKGGKIYRLNDISKLDLILEKMHSELVENKTDGNIFASAYVGVFLAEFARQAGLIKSANETVEKTGDRYYAKFIRLKDYIQYHYMHNIQMQELCSLVNISPQHLCRIFKKCCGMRPVEYILRVRIDAAKELLANSCHEITKIADWCGFENDNYFWKTFKKITGLTPGEYRRINICVQ